MGVKRPLNTPRMRNPSNEDINVTANVNNAIRMDDCILYKKPKQFNEFNSPVIIRNVYSRFCHLNPQVDFCFNPHLSVFKLHNKVLKIPKSTSKS